MSFLSTLFVLSRKMSSVLSLSVFAFFSMGKAQAVTIDFDDLNPADFSGSGWYIPVTNEYESLGVLFDGYVNPAAISTKSSPNVLYGSIGFVIYFLDTLPTYVSMYVGSTDEYKVGLRARGASGYLEDQVTDGWVRGASQELSTPYRDNQFISFYIPEGISSIEIGGQGATYIDDLTFRVSVPEPHTLMLFCLGILIACLRRKGLKQKIPA